MPRTVVIGLMALLSAAAGSGCCLKYIGEKVGEGAKQSILQEDTLRNLFVEVQASGVERTTKAVRDVLLGPETQTQMAQMTERVAAGVDEVGTRVDEFFSEEKMAERRATVETEYQRLVDTGFRELNTKMDEGYANLERKYETLASKDTERILQNLVRSTAETARDEVQKNIDQLNVPLQWGTVALAAVVLGLVVLPNILLFLAHRRAQRTLRELTRTFEAGRGEQV